jgi:hypothetical protein
MGAAWHCLRIVSGGVPLVISTVLKLPVIVLQF